MTKKSTPPSSRATARPCPIRCASAGVGCWATAQAAARDGRSPPTADCVAGEASPLALPVRQAAGGRATRLDGIGRAGERRHPARKFPAGHGDPARQGHPLRHLRHAALAVPSGQALAPRPDRRVARRPLRPAPSSSAMEAGGVAASGRQGETLAARDPGAGGGTRGSLSCPGSRSPTSARTSSPSSAAACRRTGPSATTQRPCSSRPSSRRRATLAPSTRHRAGSMSAPPGGAADTTGTSSTTSPGRISGSGPYEEIGNEPSIVRNPQPVGCCQVWRRFPVLASCGGLRIEASLGVADRR